MRKYLIKIISRSVYSSQSSQTPGRTHALQDMRGGGGGDHTAIACCVRINNLCTHGYICVLYTECAFV